MPDNKICPKFELLPIFLISVTRKILDILLIIKFVKEYDKTYYCHPKFYLRKKKEKYKCTFFLHKGFYKCYIIILIILL